MKKEENTIFYKKLNGTIPLNVIDDFAEDSNFLLLFVNPKSGSQQGEIILEYIKKYKENSVQNYNIIHFPQDDQDEWFSLPFKTRSRSNSIQSFESH